MRTEPQSDLEWNAPNPTWKYPQSDLERAGPPWTKSLAHSHLSTTASDVIPRRGAIDRLTCQSGVRTGPQPLPLPKRPLTLPPNRSGHRLSGDYATVLLRPVLIAERCT